jgi:hypothetical protein
VVKARTASRRLWLPQNVPGGSLTGQGGGLSSGCDLLLRYKSTSDGYIGTAHETGTVRTQPDDQFRNVLGRADPPDRMQGVDHLPRGLRAARELFGKRVRHAGVNSSGANRVQSRRP